MVARDSLTRLWGGVLIEDLSDNDEAPASAVTDAETGKTYGYEGDFKVGDVVRVKDSIRIWSVKEYAKEGFVCQGYQGTVKELALYGRKQKVKTTCARTKTLLVFVSHRLLALLS